MSEPRTEMVLLFEAPMQDAKELRDHFERENVTATLVRPEACGRRS